jgi:hypothetical protein
VLYGGHADLDFMRKKIFLLWVVLLTFLVRNSNREVSLERTIELSKPVAKTLGILTRASDQTSFIHYRELGRFFSSILKAGVRTGSHFVSKFSDEVEYARSINAVSKDTPAIFVCIHHGLVTFTFAKLLLSNLDCVLVAKNSLQKQNWTSCFLGRSSLRPQIIKPSDSIFFEIRSFLRTKKSVLICVDYPLGKGRGRAISDSVFRAAEALKAKVVFTHARMDREGHIELIFDALSNGSTHAEGSAYAFLSWVAQYEPRTKDWKITSGRV